MSTINSLSVKKSSAAITLALFLVSAACPAALAAVFVPAVSNIANVTAVPTTFRIDNSEQTVIQFDLKVAPATVWVDIMQNGVTLNRLFDNAGTHITVPGTYFVPWNGTGDKDHNIRPGTSVQPGTYQYLITVLDDATVALYTAQDNVTVTKAADPQGVRITTGNATPNPFNPNLSQQTTVAYTLNTNANMNIDVVDGGTVVAQLATNQPQGTFNTTTSQSITWNGLRTIGSGQLPPKTYFIRLTGSNGAAAPFTTTVPVALDYGTTTTTPTLQYVNVENSTFNPNVSTNRIHYAVTGSGTAVVKIFDANNTATPVKTFGAVSVTNGNDNVATWDGTDNGNVNKVSAGTYFARVELSNGTGIVDTKQSANFVVDYGTVNTAPVVTSAVVTPSSINPTLGENATISYSLNKVATSAMVQILEGNAVRRTISNTGTSMSTNFVTFNGREGDSSSSLALQPGTYTVKVSATNAFGTGTFSTTVTITNNGTTNAAPVVTFVTANPTSFNAYNSESTTLSYGLDKVANSATVQILDGNSVLRTMTGGTSSSSTNFVNFNGRGDFNNQQILPVGTYTVKVSATNSFGTGTNTTTVYISDNGGNNGNCNSFVGTPNITNLYASPSNFNPINQSTNVFYNLNSSANVTVDVLYSNGALAKNLYNNVCRTPSNTSISWDGRDSNGAITDGIYTIRVRASNAYGTDTQNTYVTVNRNGVNNGGNNGNVISNLYVAPELFNPLANQTATVYYNLNQSAVVTTEVLDRNGVLIRTLVDNVSRYINTGSYNYADQWNGRDRNGNPVLDNTYQIRVTARTSNSGTDVRSGWVEVDTNGSIIGYQDGSNCAGFRDVSSNSPYCRAIQAMKDGGIFTGYSDGTFRPYQSINRGEALKVIWLALGLPINGYYGGNMFTDVNPGAWYAPYIRAAKMMGIIRGYPDGTFRAERTINRVELLKIFLEASSVNIPYCNTSPYRDVAVNGDTRWFVDYVCFSKNNGLMRDDGTGRFAPTALMTRGDVADLFYQFDAKNLYNKNTNPYFTGTYVNNNSTNNYYSCTYSNGGYYSTNGIFYTDYNSCVNSNNAYINGTGNINYNNASCVYSNGGYYKNGIFYTDYNSCTNALNYNYPTTGANTCPYSTSGYRGANGLYYSNYSGCVSEGNNYYNYNNYNNYSNNTVCYNNPNGSYYLNGVYYRCNN